MMMIRTSTNFYHKVKYIKKKTQNLYKSLFYHQKIGENYNKLYSCQKDSLACLPKFVSSLRGYPHGLQNRSKRVHTPVVLLHSLSGKYPRERYESPYPPSNGLNSTTTVLLG